jgi:hypothetical protein
MLTSWYLIFNNGPLSAYYAFLHKCSEFSEVRTLQAVSINIFGMTKSGIQLFSQEQMDCPFWIELSSTLMLLHI